MTSTSHSHSTLSESSDLSGTRPVDAGKRHALRGIAGLGVLVASGALTGCGFALRQAPHFVFTSASFTGNVTTSVSRALQRELAATGIQVTGAVPRGGPAVDVVLNVQTDQRERAVVGQTSSGQVRELQLRTRFRYSLSTPRGKELIESTELLLEREISFTETGALAKAAEEQLMFNDMQGDVVQQIMRRLAAVKSL